MSKKLFFSFAITLPIIILMGLLYTPLMTYVLGDEIVLKTVPLDPRDPFRGDYVRLNFEINQINSSLIDKSVFENAEKNNRKRSIRVYVWLDTISGVDEVVRVSLDKPENNRFLSGQISTYFLTDNYYRVDQEKIQVKYSLDRYFVPENTGTELEDLARSGDLYVKVKVYHGYPVIIETLTKTP